MSGVCACPLHESMEGMPLSVKYRFGDRCRKRAYRARVKVAADAVGLQVAPSLSAAHALGSTKAHAGHAQTAKRRTEKRRPELRISYRKAVEALTAAYAPEGHEDESRQFIERTLSQVLPPRARAQVEQLREEAA